MFFPVRVGFEQPHAACSGAAPLLTPHSKQKGNCVGASHICCLPFEKLWQIIDVAYDARERGGIAVGRE